MELNRMKQSHTLAETSSGYDYIIVGAGSAGCVLAHRLSANPKVKVLVLEAGPDEEPFWVRTPAGVGGLFLDPRLNWKFWTDEEAQLSGRRVYWPRGKIVGGSSAINGMIYMRGESADYDRWDELGNRGWSWAEVLPYFKKAESSDLANGDHRGETGPLRVSRPYAQHPITDAFVQAGVAAGLAVNPDVTSGVQDGVGYVQHTIGNGIRHSTARAYLRPIRKRKNLTIIGDALVHRVVIENGRAIGVKYHFRGSDFVAQAHREVILSAGAVGSPQILMLSGVGARDQLQAVGLDIKSDLPGVGENLQDHLAVNAGYEVAAGMSLNIDLRGVRKALNGARYLLTKKGPLAVGVSHAVAFVRSAESVATPDLQISFRPLSLAFNKNDRVQIHPFPGVQFAGAILRPQSRGVIRLRSADPTAAPSIRANYLSAAGDERCAVAVLQWIRRIVGSRPLKDLVQREDLPGPQYRNDQELLSFVRNSSQTLYHPVGTCKMGSDKWAVVDERLRVHRVLNLRVVDASIMPTIISGNTNAPTIMIGEKAADMILQDAGRSQPQRQFHGAA
jgi:choline dehydrogenase